MTTMLEQSARALAVAWYCRDDDDEETKAQAAEQWPGFTVLARAALQAIREPDETVLAAALSRDDRANFADKAFTDIIDAILEEKPE